MRRAPQRRRSPAPGASLDAHRASGEQTRRSPSTGRAAPPAHPNRSSGLRLHRGGSETGRPAASVRASGGRRRRDRRAHAPAARSRSVRARQIGPRPHRRAAAHARCFRAHQYVRRPAAQGRSRASPMAWTAQSKPASLARAMSCDSSSAATSSTPRRSVAPASPAYGSWQYAVRVLSEPSMMTLSGPTLSNPWLPSTASPVWSRCAIASASRSDQTAAHDTERSIAAGDAPSPRVE